MEPYCIVAPFFGIPFFVGIAIGVGLIAIILSIGK